MHGNCDALDAVLNRVKRKNFDGYLVLGDLVGYGGGPNQVVDTIRELPGESIVIRGNHDKVAAGLESGENFNGAALQAARWTAERLTESNLKYIRELPVGPVTVDDQTVVCHGSPLDEDAYTFSDFDAYQIFSRTEATITFFGHTHIPSLFIGHEGGIEVQLLRDSGRISIDPSMRYLINPGSVGQPRDRDPRAAYMIFDREKMEVRWYRLEYPVQKAQSRITKTGLPAILADRLSVGI